MKKIIASVILMSSLSVFAQDVQVTSESNELQLQSELASAKFNLRSVRASSRAQVQLLNITSLNDRLRASQEGQVYELNARVLFDQNTNELSREIERTEQNYEASARSNNELPSGELYSSPSNGAAYYAENELEDVLQGQRLEENQNPYIELMAEVFESYYLFARNQNYNGVGALSSSLECNEVNLIALSEISEFLVSANERLLAQEGENQSLFQLRMTILSHEAKYNINDMKFMCQFADQRAQEYQALINSDFNYEIEIIPAATEEVETAPLDEEVESVAGGLSA